MIKDILITTCFAIYWIWSVLDMIFDMDLLVYCYYILPCFIFAFVIKISDSKKENSKDALVQTDSQNAEFKIASTQTDDAYACGDIANKVVKTPDGVPLDFEHFERNDAGNTNPFINKQDFEYKDNISTTDDTIVFQFPELNAVSYEFENFERNGGLNTNPFIERQDFECSYKDTTSTTNGTIVFPFSVPNSQKQNNPFIEQIETQVQPTSFPEPPDFDNSLFEIEEQELIDIFEKPCLINNPFAEAYLNNPFNDSIVFLDNPYEMLFKTERSLKKLEEENTNPFLILTERS